MQASSHFSEAKQWRLIAAGDESAFTALYRERQGGLQVFGLLRVEGAASGLFRQRVDEFDGLLALRTARGSLPVIKLVDEGNGEYLDVQPAQEVD